MQRAFVYADANGVRRSLIVDDERPDQFTVKTEQDIEPLLDSVARDRELMAHNGVNKLAARIPVSIYERSVHEEWSEQTWKRWLNSAEAEPFRIWKGRL
jgi:hypothetical protein